MHAFTLFATLASLAVASASTSRAFLPPGANPVSAPTDFTLDKRTFCFLGICLGETAPNYMSDVNNWCVRALVLPSPSSFDPSYSPSCAPSASRPFR